MPDTCRCCTLELPDGPSSCPRCGTTRNSTWAVMVAEHVAELMDEGVVDVLELCARLDASGRYLTPMPPAFVAQQKRLVSKDTTGDARRIAKARAVKTMLEVLEGGDTKDKLAVLKGIQVLGDVVEHKGEFITRHVVELNEGPPPKS